MTKRFEMPVGVELKIARRVYSMHYKLVRTIIHKRIRARLALRGIELAASTLEDMEDDATARSWELFCRCLPKCDRPVDALRMAARIAAKKVSSRRESALGSARSKGYVDALDHRGTAKRVGLDDLPGKHNVTELAQQEALIALYGTIMELPVELRQTAEYASRGVTQTDSAVLQGIAMRTVTNHYSKIRKVLGQRIVYGMLCSAVNEAISRR